METIRISLLNLLLIHLFIIVYIYQLSRWRMFTLARLENDTSRELDQFALNRTVSGSTPWHGEATNGRSFESRKEIRFFRKRPGTSCPRYRTPCWIFCLPPSSRSVLRELRSTLRDVRAYECAVSKQTILTYVMGSIKVARSSWKRRSRTRRMRLTHERQSRYCSKVNVSLFGQ